MLVFIISPIHRHTPYLSLGCRPSSCSSQSPRRTWFRPGSGRSQRYWSPPRTSCNEHIHLLLFLTQGSIILIFFWGGGINQLREENSKFIRKGRGKKGRKRWKGKKKGKKGRKKGKKRGGGSNFSKNILPCFDRVARSSRLFRTYGLWIHDVTITTINHKNPYNFQIFACLKNIFYVKKKIKK